MSMTPEKIIGLIQGLMIGVLVLGILNLYLVFRLRDIDPFRRWNANSINAFLFLLFGVVGFGASIAATIHWWDKLMFWQESASEHGEDINRMFKNTMYVTIAVVVVTHVLLFFYAWKYRGKKGNKALYYPHNNNLELIWTAVPFLVLTILVADGVITWHKIFRDVPKEAIHIELNGKQFDWTIRYPGEDLEFGFTGVDFIEDGEGNTVGFNFGDKRGHDDLISQEIHIPVGVPVNFTVKSRDVLHSATMPHFRMKMDAVPGMPTQFWFTPRLTTAEMRTKSGNPDFNYEMSCQQICGGGHWNMRRVIVVETMDEYKRWLTAQKPFYATWKEMFGPKEAIPTIGEAPVADANADKGTIGISMN